MLITYTNALRAKEDSMEQVFAWVVVVLIVVVAVIPWTNVKKHIVQDMKDIDLPDACFDCNRGHCKGCALDGLNKAQSEELQRIITKQSIEGNLAAYKDRFLKEVK
jgi:hypothetical protein